MFLKWSNQKLDWRGGLGGFLTSLVASLVAQKIKNLPAMQETLGQEDPRKKEMATLSSILAWRILWREEPCRLQSIASQRVQHD